MIVLQDLTVGSLVNPLSAYCIFSNQEIDARHGDTLGLNCLSKIGTQFNLNQSISFSSASPSQGYHKGGLTMYASFSSAWETGQGFYSHKSQVSCVYTHPYTKSVSSILNRQWWDIVHSSIHESSGKELLLDRKPSSMRIQEKPELREECEREIKDLGSDYPISFLHSVTNSLARFLSGFHSHTINTKEEYLCIK